MWRQMKIIFLSVLLVGEANVMVNRTCFCLQEDDKKFATHSGLPNAVVSMTSLIDLFRATKLKIGKNCHHLQDITSLPSPYDQIKSSVAEEKGE